MCKVISSESLRKANERCIAGDRSGISMDNKTGQISVKTLFGTQTITVSRDSISRTGRGSR